MIVPALAYLLDRLPFGNSLEGISQRQLSKLMWQSKAPSWHEYAITSRKWRRHACTACRWLNAILPRNSSIFEPGCGSAANLLWLGQQGFQRLYGSDISNSALELGQNLASLLSLPLEVWHDDGLSPTHLPNGLDGILCATWLHGSMTKFRGINGIQKIESYLRKNAGHQNIRCDLMRQRSVA